MPLGGSRSRNSKRGSSSSSSYTSVITTVAFTALCIVGIWMLNSNSVVPPQTTNRAAAVTDTTSSGSDTTDTDISLSNEPQRTDTGGTRTDTDLYSSNEPRKMESSSKKDQPVFEDNPGDLPVDAIESDEPKSNKEDDTKIVAQNSESLKGKESAEEQEKQEQKQNQNQISEESTITQNKEIQETTQESSASESGKNVQEFQTQNSGNDQDQQPDGDSEKQMLNEEQQQQPQDDVKIMEKGQDFQDSKSYKEQQEQQRREDAGILSSTQESQKQPSDKQQEPENQEQQLEQKQEILLNTQQGQQKQVFQDVTAPGVEQAEDQASGKTTQDTKTKTDIQASGRNSETASEATAGNKAEGESAFPDSGTSGIPKESKESKKSWSTQKAESDNEKERRKDESEGKGSIYGYTWQLCNVTAGADYIPCLDNEKALRHLHTTGHYEHRERHCPEDAPDCLVPLPEGYKRSLGWPQSRDKIWYHNVPHTKLAEVKGHQNWVKVAGEFLTFPGGGTQFIHGALHYVDFIQQAEPKIAWGKHTRVLLDVGCGVASFGGYLFERDVLTMSFAPKDEHEAQVQFALERGIPAISAVMGSQRLPFPSRVFDLVHCARCRVPWHNEGGLLLLELNRVLRPGGYFVWSATPVYQKLEEDVKIWKAMSALTVSMCWELVTIKKDKLNSIGAAVYRKPASNDCYDQRKKNSPPMCKNEDDPNAAWYVPLQACMHRIPVGKTERGSQWPVEWPRRLQTPPYWLNNSQMGIYGKPAPQDFARDYEHWKLVVGNSYMNGLGISWSNVRNVMDMRAVYGGFAAALRDLKVWVLNVVNIDSPDTLPVIYERGLFGIYHDWCESFSTYPRTYDLLHADHLFSMLAKRCKLAPVMAEVDRIVRPGGKLIVRDESSAIGEVENLLKSLRWEVHLTFSKDQEGLLSAQKGDWRPQAFAASL